MADGLDALRCVAGDGGLHQFGGDLLFLDEDGSRGPVGGWQRQGGDQADDKDEQGDARDGPAPALEGVQVVLEVFALFFLHVASSVLVNSIAAWDALCRSGLWPRTFAAKGRSYS